MANLNEHPLILKYIEHNSFGDLIGMEFSIHSAGVVKYTLEIQQKHLATITAAHGGLIAALMDATLGVGALSHTCNFDKVVSTVDMNISFLNPVKLGDKLIAESNLLKAGSRILFMEALIYNQDGLIVSKGSGTFNAYPREKAGY
jgi:acyl-CoA thioesterase